MPYKGSIIEVRVHKTAYKDFFCFKSHLLLYPAYRVQLIACFFTQSGYVIFKRRVVINRDP